MIKCWNRKCGAFKAGYKRCNCLLKKNVLGCHLSVVEEPEELCSPCVLERLLKLTFDKKENGECLPFFYIDGKVAAKFDQISLEFSDKEVSATVSFWWKGEKISESSVRWFKKIGDPITIN